MVPKKPEPEKKVPPPGLKKAVAPPAKGTSPQNRNVFVVPTLNCDAVRTGHSTYTFALYGLSFAYPTCDPVASMFVLCHLFDFVYFMLALYVCYF